MFKKLLGFVLILFGVISVFGIFFDRSSGSPNIDMMNNLTKVIYPFLFTFLGIGCFRKKHVTDEGVEYVESPIRALSMFIDSMIFTVPCFLIQTALLKGPFFLYFGFTILFGLFIQALWAFLLVRFGATPGKMLMKIVILKDDMSQMGIREVLLRMSVDLAWGLLSTIGSILVFLSISFEEFRSLGFQQRSLFLLGKYPTWLIFVIVIQQYWMWSEVIVMFFNRRRKAIHDYIAGTIVVKRMKKSEKILSENI